MPGAFYQFTLARERLPTLFCRWGSHRPQFSRSRLSPSTPILDGELVAIGDDGWPYFPLVCARMLNGDTRVRLTYIIFDVLELERRRATHLPYVERRRLLESLQLEGPHWRTSPSFDDGEAVFAVACERGLEGVVAKRLRASYRPGERGWLKIKNRRYWRYPLEREAAADRREQALRRTRAVRY